MDSIPSDPGFRSDASQLAMYYVTFVNIDLCQIKSKIYTTSIGTVSFLRFTESRTSFLHDLFTFDCLESVISYLSVHDELNHMFAVILSGHTQKN